MKKYLNVCFAAVFLFAGAAVFSACKRGVETAAKAAAYHCPMHPTYVSDRPGDCPICGMRLVPLEAKPEGEEKPASDRSPVTLSGEREQLIGVKTSPVVRRDLSKLVRASGRIAYDPDLYSAVVEYREALKSLEKAKSSPWADVRERTEGLVSSSHLRLQQMGLSDSQIQRLGRAKEDPTNLLLGQKGGSVWVYAQIYEYEIGLVQSGQVMDVDSVAYPGHRFTGRVVAEIGRAHV